MLRLAVIHSQRWPAYEPAAVACVDSPLPKKQGEMIQVVCFVLFSYEPYGWFVEADFTLVC